MKRVQRISLIWKKTNSIKKNIKKIKHQGKEIINQQEILECIANYYKELYTEEKVDINHDLFNQYQIPKLNMDEQFKCEGLITSDECSKILSDIAKNKTPGNDGLPIEFYIEFWNDIKQMMINSFNYSFEHGLLTTSQRQAIISLLDKPGKDRLFLDNWRPISLLNIDYENSMIQKKFMINL